MKQYALLVGIERYEDPAFPPVEFAETDAADLAVRLRRAGGYALTEYLARPCARGLLDAAAAAAAGLAPGDTLLFYFAGHAATAAGRPVLVCPKARGARLRFLQEVVPLELLLAETAAPGVARVFLLDTATAAPILEPFAEVSSDFASAARKLAETMPGNGAPFALIGAAGPGERTPVSVERRCGGFIEALTEEWRDPRHGGRGAVLDGAFVSELARRLRARSGAAATPWAVFAGGQAALGPADPAGAEDGVAAPPAAAAPPAPWFGFSREYRETLSRRISKRAGCLYGAEVEGVDGAALFEAGVAREVEWRFGVPLAVLEWPALIAARRRMEIEICLGAATAEAESDDLTYLLRLLYRDRDAVRARYELDKAHVKGIWIEPALLLAAEFGNKAEGRRYLAECSAWPGKDARFLAACARAWRVLIGDDREAARCLETAEGRAQDAQDFETLAAAAHDLFSDARAAWRLLARAESVAQGARDWATAGAGWMRIFNDGREADRCLSRAERVAVAARDWMACATGWLELLDDSERAREDIEASERAVHESWEWQDCAERWIHLFNDEASGRRCLSQAERRAQHFGEWRDCAAAWRRLLNETAETRACLAEAQRHAADALDWEVLASDWLDLLRDEQESARCRAQAERLRARR